ncbi:MAG: SUF system NifU family Fe-S cluster assembly protein [Acidimicrobiia bacterium]|nr:SUF system NifU family Fe-S cluster assembly protein [Acidimicrobiia bacterium]MYC58359.1 SUF system NifU family Fe-S cluster assembly protein [Acidimicrobiia bacterium]MYG94118.1 SUF system NifU family Fe-S cluster assembly protein [Acidimicrobiia bacterium]MYI30535.1 SUF system NifU family Fe-S cluster assembly protein [Acidimicrobiia bacterium]
MPELEDLYREIILDHYRNPRNRGELESPPAIRAEGFNPLCGDEIIIFIETDGEVVQDIKFGGQGCSISQASASMMSTAVKGRTTKEVGQLNRTFKTLMSIAPDPNEGDAEDADNATDAAHEPHNSSADIKLGDIEALRGVVKFPVRIKCATLCWHTLIQALEEAQATT